jgi:hypothetical protein
MTLGPEAAIKARIRGWFLQHGAYVFAPVQMGLGMSTVDQLVCFKGKFLGIESKVPGKHPTARQYQALKEISAAGGQAYWVTSLEDLKEQMVKNGGWAL